MRQGLFEIWENEPLVPGLYRLVLGGDTGGMTAPGQFADVGIDGYFLRRPISLCDWDDVSLTLIYKLMGNGTRTLSGYPAGVALDVLTGLGNGYDLKAAGERPLLVGGGVGIPPLYRLAKELLARGSEPVPVLGFNRKEEMFLVEEFRALGLRPVVAAADGSGDVKGFVTDALPAAGEYTYVYACGPTGMLRALDSLVTTDAQYSFEARMGCGFGACMGCTVETKGGAKRVCRDGPVFRREEILW